MTTPSFGGKTPAELRELVYSWNVTDYGFRSEKLNDIFADALDDAADSGVTPVLAVGLNNADFAGILLQLLETDAEGILRGMQLAAAALGAETAVLYLPEYADDALLTNVQKKAETCGIAVERSFINVRQYPACAYIHLVTALRLAAHFDGKPVTSVWLSTDGKTLTACAPETKLSTFYLETEKIKGFYGSCRYFTKNILDKTVADLPEGDALLLPIMTTDCPVALTEERLLAARKCSCGKCVFCREGLNQLHYMQLEITGGRGKTEHIELTKEIGEAMLFSTPCSLGRNMARIALTALDVFAEEYDEHIKKKNCPAGKCMSSTTFYIDPFKCTGCTDCADVCPDDCIEGRKGYIHMIDEFDCTACGKCASACEEEAVISTTGKLPKLPDRLTKVGRFKKR